METNKMLLNIGDLNVKGFALTQLRDNPFTQTQQLSIVKNKYNDTTIMFQAPHIITECYGAPKAVFRI